MFLPCIYRGRGAVCVFLSFPEGVVMSLLFPSLQLEGGVRCAMCVLFILPKKKGGGRNIPVVQLLTEWGAVF